MTPEYPDGIYAYFATVDENWNSAYPYVVGPTFYGDASNRKVNSVNESTTVYEGTTSIAEADFKQLSVSVFPNPSTDLIAIQINDLVDEDFQVELWSTTGQLISQTQINKGQTIAYFDVQTVYNGTYLVKISNGQYSIARKVLIVR